MRPFLALEWKTIWWLLDEKDLDNSVTMYNPLQDNILQPTLANNLISIM
jgi:hypothetical protein